MPQAKRRARRERNASISDWPRSFVNRSSEGCAMWLRGLLSSVEFVRVSIARLLSLLGPELAQARRRAPGFGRRVRFEVDDQLPDLGSIRESSARFVLLAACDVAAIPRIELHP